MSEKKDFLNSLVNEKKPASFQEEKVEKIEKKPMDFSKVLLIFVIIAILLGVGYYVFLAPKISMPNFVGKQTTELNAWVKQYEIEASGIVVTSEYNKENKENTILEQSILEGEKITKKAKINFVISKGADPDEIISFPNLKNMELTEINNWIKDNQLTNTKITTINSDEVDENKVISYELKNINENEFTRSSSLTITVSKGPKEKAMVSIDVDYVNRSLSELQNFCSNKNLILNYKEVNDDKVEAGYIVSVSVKKGDKVKEGNTIEATVSKGAAIYLIDFTNKTEKEVDKWAKEHNFSSYVIEKKYNEAKEGLVYWQDIKANTKMGEYDVVTIYISLGIPEMPDMTGSSLENLKAWVKQIEENNAIKFKLVDDNNPVFSEDIAVGNIYQANQDGITITYTLSKGHNIWIDDLADLSWDKVVDETNPANNYTEEEVRRLCSENNVNYKITYVYSDTVEANHVVSIRRSDNKVLKAQSYVAENVTIEITICDK